MNPSLITKGSCLSFAGRPGWLGNSIGSGRFGGGGGGGGEWDTGAVTWPRVPRVSYDILVRDWYKFSSGWIETKVSHRLGGSEA